MNRMNEKKEHFEKLAREMKVHVYVGNEFKSSADKNIIWIEVMDSDADYASGMHELGHQHSRMHGVKSPYLYIRCRHPRNCREHSKEFWKALLIGEYAAWEFAKKEIAKAGFEWSEEMEQDYQGALGSYIYGAGRAFRDFGINLISFLEEEVRIINLEKVNENG